MSSTTKRKLFHKNLPRLVRRKLFIKPVDEETEYEIEPRTFIVLHISYNPIHINNETIQVFRHLSSRDERSAYSSECPYYEMIPSDKDYKGSIRAFMSTQFGINDDTITRIQYKTQVILNDNYFNIYHVELSSLHENFPSEYESRMPYLFLSDSDEVVEEPTAIYHKNKWIWKQTIYLHGERHAHTISVDFFDDATLQNKKTKLCTL